MGGRSQVQKEEHPRQSNEESAREPFYSAFRQPQVWQQPPEALANGVIGVAEALVPALEAIIAHHVGVPGLDSVLIEGDGIAPAIAATTILHHLLWGGNMPLEGKERAVALSNDLMRHSIMTLPSICGR